MTRNTNTKIAQIQTMIRQGLDTHHIQAWYENTTKLEKRAGMEVIPFDKAFKEAKDGMK